MILVVSFCISSDTVKFYLKFFNKTASYDESSSGILSFFIRNYFLYACRIMIESVCKHMICGYITAYCVKFTDCQLLMDNKNGKVHDAQ